MNNNRIGIADKHLRTESRILLLLDSLNNSLKSLNIIYLSFISALVYTGVIISSVSDEMLLTDSPVTLPLLRTEVPITGFFLITPFLLAMLHIDILMQFTFISNDIKNIIKLAKGLKGLTSADVERSLNGSHYVYLFSHVRFNNFYLANAYKIYFFLILVLFPNAILLWLQGRFLAYHDVSYTNYQALAVILDAVISLILWNKLSSTGESCYSDSRNFNSALEKFTYQLLIAVSILLSYFVFTVPSDSQPWRENPWKYIPACIIFNQSCSILVKDINETNRPDINDFFDWWFKARNLNLAKRQFLTSSTNTALNKPIDNACVNFENFNRVSGLDLRGRDLRWAIFSNSTLSNALLGENNDHKKTKLDNANLQFANLINIDLNKASLVGADLSHSCINGTNLSGANLTGAIMHDVRIINTNLTSATLDNANMNDSIIYNSKLINTHLVGVRSESSLIYQSDFTGADMKKTKLLGSYWFKSDLNRVKFDESHLNNSYFVKTNLRSVEFRFSIAREMHLVGVNYTQADFSGTKYDGSCVYKSRTASNVIGISKSQPLTPCSSYLVKTNKNIPNIVNSKYLYELLRYKMPDVEEFTINSIVDDITSGLSENKKQEIKKLFPIN